MSAFGCVIKMCNVPKCLPRITKTVMYKMTPLYPIGSTKNSNLLNFAALSIMRAASSQSHNFSPETSDIFTVLYIQRWPALFIFHQGLTITHNSSIFINWHTHANTWRIIKQFRVVQSKGPSFKIYQ
jgi:hypothetical protein